jgi:hypothetical protein
MRTRALRFLLPVLTAIPLLFGSAASADTTADLNNAPLVAWQSHVVVELAAPAAAATATAPAPIVATSPTASTLPDVDFPAPGHEAPPATAGEAIDRALEAGTRSHYAAAIVLALMALVGGVRVVSATVRNSKLLGWGANFLLGFLGTMGLALEVGYPLTWTLALQALIYSLTAAGGWKLAKDVGVAPGFLRKSKPPSSPAPLLRREV